ncbi:MAG: hypothetical protein ABSB28_08615 [Candidatus Bathyarchaeia archaeon]
MGRQQSHHHGKEGVLTSGEVTENFDVKGHRTALFSQLAHVLVVSKNKFDKECAANRDRQAWGRLIVTGIEAYAKLLETVQLDVLEKRVSQLEGREGEAK